LADLRERAEKLGEAVSNLEVFRWLLAELDDRTAPPKPALGLSAQQIQAVSGIRAALLRSAIGLVVAILDPTRHDRASLGRVVEIVGDGAAFVEMLGPHGSGIRREKLQHVCDRYPEVCGREAYQRLLQLRHNEIGHLLIKDTPTSERPELFELVDEIKRLVGATKAGRIGAFWRP
jgi:hypothetical protein